MIHPNVIVVVFNCIKLLLGHQRTTVAVSLPDAGLSLCCRNHILMYDL